jgi:thioredoxin-related protein
MDFFQKQKYEHTTFLFCESFTLSLCFINGSEIPLSNLDNKSSENTDKLHVLLLVQKNTCIFANFTNSNFCTLP